MTGFSLISLLPFVSIVAVPASEAGCIPDGSPPKGR